MNYSKQSVSLQNFLKSVILLPVLHLSLACSPVADLRREVLSLAKRSASALISSTSVAVIQGIQASDDLNSTNAGTLVDGLSGDSLSQWVPLNVWDSKQYPMVTTFDLGATYDVNEIKLFHGDGGSGTGMVSVSYLPPNNSSYQLIENHHDSVWNEYATVSQSGLLRTRFLRFTINSASTYYAMSEVQVSGTLVTLDPGVKVPAPISGMIATDLRNSVNAKVLVNDIASNQGSAWESSNIWNSANYPMTARLDLGAIYTVSAINLFHGNGTSGRVLVSYLPAVSGADQYVVVESHSDSVFNNYSAVAVPSPLRTRYLEFTIASKSDYYTLMQAQVIGTTEAATPAPSAAPSASPKPSATPIPAAAPMKIVVIGSSTSAGEGASDYSNAWVAQMYAALDYATGATLVQTNLSVGGSKSADLMTSGDSDRNITKALSFNPDLIIVGLAGGNDIASGVSQSTFLANVQNIKNAAAARRIPIFFTGTSPKSSFSFSERQQLQTWNSAMRSTVQSCVTPKNSAYSSCFIDVFSTLSDPNSLMIRPNYEYGDGVHLNDSGHDAYESVALPVVKAYVCSVMQCTH